MFRNYEKENNCLIIHDTAGFIRLTPFSNRIIRVQFSQNRESSIRCTEMILPQNVDEVSWNVVEGNVTLKYYSDEVQLIYHKDKGTLTFLDKAQEILLREPENLPRQLETRLICEPLSPDNMETIYENSADGIKARVIEKDKECIRQSSAYRTKQKFVFSEEEALYGLCWGEGPTEIPKEGTMGEVEGQAVAYTCKDIRFTCASNCLYAIFLGWPENGEVVIHTLSRLRHDEIRRIGLIGFGDIEDYRMETDGLHVKLPDQKPCEHAFVLKIYEQEDVI